MRMSGRKCTGNPTRLLETAAWVQDTGRVSVGMASRQPHSTRTRPHREGSAPMNALAINKQHAVLHLLIEGNSIRSTERLTGVHRDTIINLLVIAGNLAGDMLYRRMRGLRPRHIEVDEIWTFVEKKQGHLKAHE